jgi:hypothetical protein
MEEVTVRKLLRTNYVFVTIACIIGGWAWAETAAVSKTEQPAAQVVNTSAPGVKNAAVVRQKISLRNANGNACGLLRSSDFQRVQGEQLKDVKPTDRVENGLRVAQCFYGLATASKSVALTLMMRDGGPNGRDPREFWNETFHREKARGAEKESDSEKEREADVEAIRGVGDEAFWSGNRFGGALYILKGNTLVRLSIGGADNQETRIRKSKALAQTVLRHL